MAEEKDTAAPAKRTTGKTGRRKKPEAEHAARAAPQDKDTGSKAQEILEQARTEPKPEWEVAEQVVLLPLDRLRPFKNHPFKVNDEDELMQDTIDSIMAGGVINPILVRPAEDGKFEVVSGHRRFRALMKPLCPMRRSRHSVPVTSASKRRWIWMWTWHG